MPLVQKWLNAGVPEDGMANTYYNVKILLCIDRAFLGEYSNALWKSGERGEKFKVEGLKLKVQKQRAKKGEEKSKAAHQKTAGAQCAHP